MKKGHFRLLVQLAQELREKHALLNSWPKASLECGVVTEDGRADPGLAQRIALQGYDPKREETRTRLRLPPVCVTCGSKIKRVRVVPAWLNEAVANLQRLEAAAQPKPDKYRVYARGGKRVRNARPYKAV
jgi:hypothetical protein